MSFLQTFHEKVFPNLKEVQIKGRNGETGVRKRELSIRRDVFVLAEGIGERNHRGVHGEFPRFPVLSVVSSQIDYSYYLVALFCIESLQKLVLKCNYNFSSLRGFADAAKKGFLQNLETVEVWSARSIRIRS